MKICSRGRTGDDVLDKSDGLPDRINQLQQLRHEAAQVRKERNLQQLRDEATQLRRRRSTMSGPSEAWSRRSRRSIGSSSAVFMQRSSRPTFSAWQLDDGPRLNFLNRMLPLLWPRLEKAMERLAEAGSDSCDGSSWDRRLLMGAVANASATAVGASSESDLRGALQALDEESRSRILVAVGELQFETLDPERYARIHGLDENAVSCMQQLPRKVQEAVAAEFSDDGAADLSDFFIRFAKLKHRSLCGTDFHLQKCSPDSSASVNEWPQQVGDDDAGSKPPPYEQVRAYEGGLNWYDWTMCLNNVEPQRASGLIKKDLPDGVPLAEDNSVRITLNGKSKSGKTWLLHQLAGLQLKVTDAQGAMTEVLHTPSLCCKHLNFCHNVCQIIDSRGENGPVFDVTEVRATDNSEGLLLRHILCDISDVLIYMVNGVSYSEQLIFMNLVQKQKAQHFDFNIVMVHNFSHLYRREDFEKAKYEAFDRYITEGLEIKRFRDIDVLLAPSAPNDSNSPQIHLFLAQQCPELTLDNEQTIGFLRKNLVCRRSSLFGQKTHSDPRRELRHALETTMSRGCFTLHDPAVSKPGQVGIEPAHASYRVVGTQNGSVQFDIDLPGYSEEQMKIDLAQDRARNLLNLAKVKPSSGVEIILNPKRFPLLFSGCGIPKDKDLCSGELALQDMAAIKVKHNVSLSSLRAEYRDGTVLLTFQPEKVEPQSD